jgi:hypothetical protein
VVSIEFLAANEWNNVQSKMLRSLFDRAALKSFIFAVLNPERHRVLDRDFGIRCMKPLRDFVLGVRRPSLGVFLERKRFEPARADLIDVIDAPSGFIATVGLPGSLTN